MNRMMVGDAPREPGVDEDAADLAATGVDPAAFTAFYERNARSVLAWFYRRTYSPQTAAELTAETFAQALASHRRYDPALGTGRAWLFGIAANLHRQWLRRRTVRTRARRRLDIATPELTEDDLDRIDDAVDAEAMRAGLRSALGDLSPAVRDAVLLRVALDQPYEQVAASLGCSVGAARVRVARGLNTLAEHLEVRR